LQFDGMQLRPELLSDLAMPAHPFRFDQRCPGFPLSLQLNRLGFHPQGMFHFVKLVRLLKSLELSIDLFHFCPQHLDVLGRSCTGLKSLYGCLQLRLQRARRAAQRAGLRFELQLGTFSLQGCQLRFNFILPFAKLTLQFVLFRPLFKLQIHLGETLVPLLDKLLLLTAQGVAPFRRVSPGNSGRRIGAETKFVRSCIPGPAESLFQLMQLLGLAIQTLVDPPKGVQDSLEHGHRAWPGLGQAIFLGKWESISIVATVAGSIGTLVAIDVAIAIGIAKIVRRTGPVAGSPRTGTAIGIPMGITKIVGRAGPAAGSLRTGIAIRITIGITIGIAIGITIRITKIVGRAGPVEALREGVVGRHLGERISQIAFVGSHERSACGTIRQQYYRHGKSSQGRGGQTAAARVESQNVLLAGDKSHWFFSLRTEVTSDRHGVSLVTARNPVCGHRSPRHLPVVGMSEFSFHASN
jgi:hypothetical protein